MAKAPLVVFVDSLADFIQEVPAPATVRLALTERTPPGGLPLREVQVRVQGRPAKSDELIVLFWTHQFMAPAGQEPVEERERVLYREIRARGRELLRDYLTAQGYKIRGGTYGLPQGIETVRGVLEVLDWQQVEAGYALRLREPVEVPA